MTDYKICKCDDNRQPNVTSWVDRRRGENVPRNCGIVYCLSGIVRPIISEKLVASRKGNEAYCHRTAAETETFKLLHKSKSSLVSVWGGGPSKEKKKVRKRKKRERRLKDALHDSRSVNSNRVFYGFSNGHIRMVWHAEQLYRRTRKHQPYLPNGHMDQCCPILMMLIKNILHNKYLLTHSLHGAESFLNS